MRVFKKQETLVQNMAYMGLMAAVNVIFIVLTYSVPFLLFLLVFLLPLCSAIISFYCKKIYFPIYFIVVSAICLLIDFSDTIFYVIPSLITGFIFGLLVEKKVPSVYIITIETIIQFGISLAFIPLIKLITNRDIVYDMAKLFSLENYEYLNYIKYTFIFFISFVQIIITFLVLYSELSKFGININNQYKYLFLLDVFSLSSLGLMILFAFLVPEISYIFLLLSFMFTISRLIYLDYSFYKIYLIELGAIVLITIFFVALLYQSINKPLGLTLVGILPALISCACLINNCLLSKHNKGKINS